MIATISGSPSSPARALPDHGRPVLPRPGHLGFVADAQQQLELLAEERVIVGEVEAEKREGLGEGAAAHHQVDPAPGDEVEGRELLEHPHRVGSAQHRHSAAEADALRAGSRGREQDCWRGVVVLAAVVLADAEGVEPDPVGECDLLQEVFDALGRPDHVAGGRVGHGGDEAVDAQVHRGGLSIRTERAAQPLSHD
jgi:hypothetical protein